MLTKTKPIFLLLISNYIVFNSEGIFISIIAPDNTRYSETSRVLKPPDYFGDISQTKVVFRKYLKEKYKS